MGQLGVAPVGRVAVHGQQGHIKPLQSPQAGLSQLA